MTQHKHHNFFIVTYAVTPDACIHLPTSTCTCMPQACIYLHTSPCTCMHIFTYKSLHVHAYIYIQVPARACIRPLQKHTYIPCTLMHIFTYKSLHVHACIPFTCMHTSTNKPLHVLAWTYKGKNAPNYAWNYWPANQGKQEISKHMKMHMDVCMCVNINMNETTGLHTQGRQGFSKNVPCIWMSAYV